MMNKNVRNLNMTDNSYKLKIRIRAKMLKNVKNAKSAKSVKINVSSKEYCIALGERKNYCPP